MFPVTFLAELERCLDRPIGSYFDLIAGASTGGVIAVALALGCRASEVRDLYESRGPEIFGQNWGVPFCSVARKFRWFRWICMHKYDSGPMRSVFCEVFGNRRIGESRTRLLVPAWNPVTRSVHLYKTAHHLRLETDYRSSAVDVALATAAAPTYFRRHITRHGVGLLDGGIWANNPIAIATVEAITLLGWPRESLHVLSLGCLEETYTFPKWAGLWTLGRKCVDLFMDGQSYGAMGIARLLTGHGHERTAIHRIDQTVPHRVYPMDDPRAIQDLKGLGCAKAREQLPILKPVFFDCPASVFTPIYRLDEERDGD